MFKITFLNYIFIPNHYFINYFSIKLGILIKDMLIYNGVSLIYPADTFHVVLNNTGLANLLLMNERLHNYIKLAPEIQNIWHHLIHSVIYFHRAVIRCFREHFYAVSWTKQIFFNFWKFLRVFITYWVHIWSLKIYLKMVINELIDFFGGNVTSFYNNFSCSCAVPHESIIVFEPDKNSRRHSDFDDEVLGENRNIEKRWGSSLTLVFWKIKFPYFLLLYDVHYIKSFLLKIKFHFTFRGISLRINCI